MCSAHLGFDMPRIPFPLFSHSIFPVHVGAHPSLWRSWWALSCVPRAGCGLGQVNENSSLTCTLSRIPGMDRKPQLLPLGFSCAKWGEIALFLLYRRCSLRMVEGCSFLVCVFPTWRSTLWEKRKVTPGHRRVKTREMSRGRNYSRARRKPSE